ncbi:MAG: GSCFA domain-containing protein [Bacteroidota bacterium]
MKNFRTVVTPHKSPFSISHKDKIVSIGSCFSENIGRKFSDYKFNININPFGQQYNPYSIANAIKRLVDAKLYTGDDLIYHDELYHSFDHHGSFSRSSKEETLRVINENLQLASEDLKNATLLFLTFGTSHVFSVKENNRIVSNCHKLSGSHFEKRLMKPDEIVTLLNDALSQLSTLNPQLKTILTVSPVRYFAFGHHENTVSKAHLFSAIHELQQQHPSYFYFPAYELVMDDLRDYRFFSEDMLHPNYQATDYVWEKLVDTMLDKKTTEVMRETDEILLAARHKPRNPNSEAHKKFVRKNLDKIGRIENEFGLHFAKEFQVLNNYL